MAAKKRLRLPASELKDTRSFAKRSSPFFIVRSRASQLPSSRFAIIVGAKTEKTSAGRHKLKRRAYEHLRLRPGKQDVVVTVLPPAKKLLRKEFLQELNKLLP